MNGDIEAVRITDVSIIDDGLCRLTLVTDTGSHVTELDRDAALRFARALLTAHFDAMEGD